MVQIPLFSEVNVVAFSPEGIAPVETIRNGLLFAEINDQQYAILSSRDMATALSSYNNLSLTLPLAHLDEQTYETLYLKFLELKTDNELARTVSQEEPYEDELSLIDFLKNSSDLLTSEESAPNIICKFYFLSGA